MLYVLTAKALIDVGVALVTLRMQPAFATMFFGFAVADVGALLLALKVY